ncbi:MULTISPECIES: hypothetical protein [unclassified Streptomyces]|uniref:hypothetical protein n=1 Tax=unclassified Streptomyces TaxID=2593676 RepID=UPI003818F534
MQLSADPAVLHIADIMRRHDIEEILEVPAAPFAGGLRYPRVVRLQPGDEPWYLRTYGTDFEIVPPGWLRRGPSRCYSLGADLDEAGERDGLLLVQAFTPDLAGAEALAKTLLEELSDVTGHLAAKWGRAWGRPCCWVAARLTAERDGTAHA